MGNIAWWEVPGWLIALVMVAESVLLVRVHHAMTWPIRLSMALPVLGLAFLILVFWLYPVHPDVRRVVGSNFLAWLFLWRAILLWTTRKQHRV